MIQRYRSLAQYVFHQAGIWMRGGPQKGSIGIIGGADGPTAIFVAGKRKPRRDPGKLEVVPEVRAISAALALSSLVILMLAAITATGFKSHRRKR